VAIVNEGWAKRNRDGVLLIVGVGVIVAGVGRWIVTGDPYAQVMVGAGMGIMGLLPVVQRNGGK
jgi:hypothetical protein